MKLSIIIPVYNVEKYLLRCLYSCTEQDIPAEEYEIVIVNDGSPDGSRAIAEEFVSCHPNAKLINQENGGLSVARNNGLKVAAGKYVWFVDSDDWIEKNCLKAIVDKMESQELDMLQVGYVEAYDDGTMIPSERGFFEGCMTGCEAMKVNYVPAPAQFTVYRRGLLNNYDLKFYPGIYHEDAEFKPRALFFAGRFASLNKQVYYYYQRPNGSIMRSYSLKRGRDVLTVCNSLYQFERDTNMTGDMVREFNYVITVYMNELFKGIEKLDKKDREVLVKELCYNKHLIDCVKSSKSKSHKFEGWLLTVNIPLGIYFINRLR